MKKAVKRWLEVVLYVEAIELCRYCIMLAITTKICENHSKLRLLFTVVNQVLRKNEAKKVDCEKAIDELLLMENCKN